MPSLISPDLIRELTDTDLSDTALQLLIDAAEAEIVTRFGAHKEDGSVLERHTIGRGERLIFLRRPIDPDSTFEVTRLALGDTEPVVVEAVEYCLNGSQVVLYGYEWARSTVTVAYTSTMDVAKRKAVLVDLVKLAIRYEAAQATRLGDAQVTHLPYTPEREQILSRLVTSIGSFE